MLKKAVIAAVASAAIVVGVGGVAYADSYDTDCSSHETTEQNNSGHQIIGGNGNFKGTGNLLGGGSADRVVICPSAGNNNDVHVFH